MPDVDILMIGNFAKDKLIVDGVEEVASGGGVYYGSVVIQRLGLRAGLSPACTRMIFTAWMRSGLKACRLCFCRQRYIRYRQLLSFG
jgi:hypothetical protein